MKYNSKYLIPLAIILSIALVYFIIETQTKSNLIINQDKEIENLKWQLEDVEKELETKDNLLQQKNKEPGPVFSCNEDTDCKFSVPSKLLECLNCDPLGCNIYNVKDNEVIAINNDWSPDCPVTPIAGMCPGCSGAIEGNLSYEAKCVYNKCKKVKITHSK